MTAYNMKLDGSNKQIFPGKLGVNQAQNPKGESFGFTNFYMTWDNQPIVPVVGEFHFSRFSYLHWEEELLKMKAGGVNIVATYVFWNYHEEEENVFQWGESRNLRHFVDLCAKHELPLILRIGPFCHGEVRNGGIPDWVFEKPLEIRSNDERYLFYAKRLYRQIAKQVKGSYFAEGGPIIGVQLENEFMHCGAPLDSWGYKAGVFMSSGKGGNEHMAELRRLAEESGIKPAFFTATAWGGAAVPEKDTLPMLAGYAYTPWIPNQPPSGEYIYRDLHVKPSEAVNYDTLEYPVAYCEMAGGMQVSYTARPNVSPESVEAMTLVKLASGSNLLGYYMYHGGSNAVGKHGYLNEYGLPKITYDYQSPLGEFGRVGKSYDRIRSLALFMEAYGPIIAPMGTVLPAGQSDIHPEDIESLRWCVRQKDGSGFLFLNNFQDHLEMPDREGVRIELDTPKGKVSFPHSGTLSLKQGTSTVLPFHIEVAGVDIITATVQPLTVLDGGKERVLVFYAHEGLEPEIVFNRKSVARVSQQAAVIIEEPNAMIVKPQVGMQYALEVTLANGETVQVIVLTRREALQVYKFRIWGEDRLFISGSRLYVKDERLNATSEGDASWSISVLPALSEETRLDHGLLTERQEGLFQTYRIEVEAYTPDIQITYPQERSALVEIDTQWPSHISDVFLQVEYDGDVAAAYLDNRLLTDHIHYGEAWPIGLKQFKDDLEHQAIHLSITPLRKGTVHTFVNQALVERFEGIELAVFHHIRPVPYYRSALFRKFQS
ncbi:beta-galactosidase [Candidatus Pristimantibacillus sp. PTI5]|uniref:beta-galactosidase n=1 Tax=Candidatus Pristimantibacillus sp. PTI5 TaxID=3400422 RepID=UPI003B0225A1